MVNQTITTVDSLFFFAKADWTYNLNEQAIQNKDLPQFIRAILSSGEYFQTDWRCGNAKNIEVGARAYLLASGSNPKGIIAAGRVIAAPTGMQLRNQHKRYSEFSETYISQDGDSYYIYLGIDSVVDFDCPLEKEKLQRMPQFRGVEFGIQRGGAKFSPDNPNAVKALSDIWKSHSMDRQAEGKGRRLVDVFLEMGDAAREDKEFEEALGYYKKALSIDPDYAKALNKQKICESIISRAKSAPPIITPYPAFSAEPQTAEDKLDNILNELEYEPSTNAEEEQQRVLTYILRRRGQPQFRQALLDAYNSKCAITDCDAEAALEAAHIIPYAETADNAPTNGILLRADLHTLFDLNLLAIHPETLQVHLHPDLRDTAYRTLHRQPINIPDTAALHPNLDYLRARLKHCPWLDSEQP